MCRLVRMFFCPEEMHRDAQLPAGQLRGFGARNGRARESLIRGKGQECRERKEREREESELVSGVARAMGRYAHRARAHNS